MFAMTHIHSAQRSFAAHFLGALIGVLLMLGAAVARAELADVQALIGQRLRANHQPFSPSTVTETLIPGLYRWDQGKNAGQIYINEAATLMLSTNGIRITGWEQPVRNPQPITDEQKRELLSEMIKSIRLDKLIHIQQGHPANQVLLLSAYDCPVCIQFERMLDAGDDRWNLDVYVLPTTLQRDVWAHVSTVRNIWCRNDNAVEWRATVKNALGGFFMSPRLGCELSMQSTDDVEVILHTLGIFKGYPFMIFGNGQVGTPSVEAKKFSAQLRENGGKAFWSEPRTEKYAYFRAAAPARGTSITIRPFDGLLQRLVKPGLSPSGSPNHRDDPS